MSMWITFSSCGTKKLGLKIGRQILEGRFLPDLAPKNRALVLALRGELGLGKTTFAQGLALGLGIKQAVTSPTFVIVKRFKIHDSRFMNFYHIDCYRLEKPEELLALGFKQILADPKNIILIEWAGKVKKALPKETVWFDFKFKGKNKRAITYRPLGSVNKPVDN